MHYSQQTRPEDPMRADLNSTRSQNQSLPKLTLNTFKKQVNIYLNLFIYSLIYYQPTALVMDNK